MKTNEILRATINFYGEEKQRFVFLGEIGELYEAVVSGDREAIIEELADVKITLAQRFIIAGVEDINGVEEPIISNLSTIVGEILKYEGRLSQGREYKTLPLHALSGWITMKTTHMRGEKEVQRVITRKLKRLLERMNENSDSDSSRI